MGSQTVELSIFLTVAKELTFQLYGWGWLVASGWLILFCMPESAEKLRPNGENIGTTGETGLKEIGRRDMVPKEVSTWLEQIERQQYNQNVVINDLKQQPVASTKTVADDRTKIPVTRSVFGSGFKKAVSEAGRWLSIQILRLIKMKQGRVVFKEENAG